VSYPIDPEHECVQDGEHRHREHDRDNVHEGILAPRSEEAIQKRAGGIKML
jgi:hypothetical protein